MDGFLKFLERHCPGDDAHDGLGDPRPLLERCGMCASMYEAHREVVKEIRRRLDERRALYIQDAALCGPGPHRDLCHDRASMISEALVIVGEAERPAQ